MGIMLWPICEFINSKLAQRSDVAHQVNYCLAPSALHAGLLQSARLETQSQD
jgi:hypothetical protein